MENNLNNTNTNINIENNLNNKNIHIIDNTRTHKTVIPTIKKIKKRVVTKNWKFAPEYFDYTNQLKLINDILNNNFNDNITNIIIQQINTKIYGYKQQDILKKRFNEIEFLNFDFIIHKMIECELKCRYCKIEMNVLYDISREIKQWSVDRIDNTLGHNINNCYLSCLECNLKKRRRTDEKFLFTKQLKIIKSDIN